MDSPGAAVAEAEGPGDREVLRLLSGSLEKAQSRPRLMQRSQERLPSWSLHFNRTDEQFTQAFAALRLGGCILFQELGTLTPGRPYETATLSLVKKFQFEKPAAIGRRLRRAGQTL